jgi:hypothetical protein
VVAALAVALGAVPVGAAKGGGSKPSVQSIDGTYLGTYVLHTTDCHWAGYGQGFGNLPWTWSEIYNTETVSVRSGTLGRGTMTWTDGFFSDTGGPWTFTGQSGTGNLVGSANFREQDPPSIWDVVVSGGTQKFAHVGYGEMSIHSSLLTGSPCEGLSFDSYPSNLPPGWDPSLAWPDGWQMDSPQVAHTDSGWLAGFLYYFG